MLWEVELIIYILLVLTALVALRVKDLLVAVVMMTLFSFSLALLFVAMGAIDVGYTEAVIGAGITGILFILVIFKTTRHTKD